MHGASPPTFPALPLTATLAQVGGAGGATQIAVWAVVLMIATIAGFWSAMWIRNRALREETGDDEGLTLGALRSMHARGELSDEEYEAARAAVLARAGVDPSKAGSAASAGGYERHAGPGVDLTGAPLPRPAAEEHPGRGDESDAGAN